MTVKGVAYGDDYKLVFCGGNVFGSVTGKTDTGGGVRSNQVKRVGFILRMQEVATNWLLTERSDY